MQKIEPYEKTVQCNIALPESVIRFVDRMSLKYTKGNRSAYIRKLLSKAMKSEQSTTNQQQATPAESIGKPVIIVGRNDYK